MPPALTAPLHLCPLTCCCCGAQLARLDGSGDGAATLPEVLAAMKAAEEARAAAASGAAATGGGWEDATMPSMESVARACPREVEACKTAGGLDKGCGEELARSLGGEMREAPSALLQKVMDCYVKLPARVRERGRQKAKQRSGEL